jgi:hypothetical protein
MRPAFEVAHVIARWMPSENMIHGHSATATKAT